MSEFRRRLMMAGKALPYDAEVEWLKASETQYIDTLIPYDSDIVIDCTFKNQVSNKYGSIFGLYYYGSDGARRWSVQCSSSTRLNPLFGTVTNVFVSYSANTWLTLKADYGKLTVNGTTKDVTTSTFQTEIPVNIYIFARHNVNYNNNTDTTDNYSSVHISSFSISQNNILLRDYIPVRVGQVGYMYDKVSGQLFGNAGTGNFIIGNDINS